MCLSPDPLCAAHTTGTSLLVFRTPRRWWNSPVHDALGGRCFATKVIVALTPQQKGFWQRRQMCWWIPSSSEVKRWSDEVKCSLNIPATVNSTINGAKPLFFYLCPQMLNIFNLKPEAFLTFQHKHLSNSPSLLLSALSSNFWAITCLQWTTQQLPRFLSLLLSCLTLFFFCCHRIFFPPSPPSVSHPWASQI